ncbi:MAG TPA: hypothetical protein PKX27_11925 [Bacteroidales bacterium]|jgi:hypothetical protein|nr:hypothetical protein [Bacteroidales bacterium]HOX75485.1 hypothetical protein [Bacteroidales bacterium]HPM88688.1 hypothetical protein [Bacteroidales bacterium]HQM68717.1 hypothetical protein [Bacteroidales bacterium]
MCETVRIIKYFALFIFIAMLTSCAPSKQNPYYKKRADASKVNTSQLGRNRYYFSSGYQKKLVKSYKKRKF